MNRKISLFLLALSIASLAFCGCDRKAFEEDIPTIIDTVDYDTDLSFTGSVFIAPGISPYFAEPLQHRANKIAASVQTAQVVICPTSFITSNADLLSEYIAHNGIIIEIEPETAGHNAWFRERGFGEIADMMKVSAYGAYKRNSYYLDDIFTVRGIDPDEQEEPSDEPASESPADKNFTNKDSVPVEIGKTAEYCNTKLNSLVRWVNTYSTIAQGVSPYDNDPAVPTQIQELSNMINNSDFTEHITYTLNVNIDRYKICKVALSDPDRISRHSTVDVDLYVTPFYAYQDKAVNPSGKGGDYYFVRQKVTSHNEPMFDTYRKKHGAVVTQANAFWLHDMHTKAQICKEGGVSDPVPSSVLSFEQTPSPTSTQGSGSFTSGFSAALNVNGQGGVMGGKPTGTITVGGTFTWSDSQTRTMSDYLIEMSTVSDTRAVEYHYKTVNTVEDDNPDKAVPAIGRTDRTDEASWCWHVNNTADKDTTTCFYLQFTVDPIYGFMYRHSTWKVEGHTKTCSVNNSDSRTIKLPRPDRTLSGVIELTSTTSMILSGVEFINNETKKVEASFNSVYQKFDRVLRQVPVGNYSVRYNVYDGEENVLIGKFIIPSVDVYTAATTQVSTLDGEMCE